MNRKIKFAIGEYYHIYNRGIEKRQIFMDNHDYERFILILKLANSTESLVVRDVKKYGRENQGPTLVDIGAWCLMPNHFHILVRVKAEISFSAFMHKLLTSYSMYFNKKHSRKGSLFESRFCAEHLNTDEYLKYIYSYIHLNPIKLIQSDWKEKGIDDIEKAKEFLNNYKYSSYIDYLDYKREENKIINKKSFPEYFESADVFEKEIFNWLNFYQG